MSIDWETMFDSDDMTDSYDNIVYDADKWINGDETDIKHEHKIGVWCGKEIRFNRLWLGHYFTDDECERLLNDETIELHGILNTKSGNLYGVKGKLMNQTLGSAQFVGFGIQETLGVDVYNSWCGHVFTDEEKNDLNDGGEVFCNNLTNKNNKQFSAYLRYDNETKRIIPRFCNETRDDIKRNTEELLSAISKYCNEKHDCVDFNIIKNSTDIISFFMSEQGRAFIKKYKADDISIEWLKDRCDEELIYQIF